MNRGKPYNLMMYNLIISSNKQTDTVTHYLVLHYVEINVNAEARNLVNVT